ncbi:MAG TPA: glycosyl hydrolase family 28-related protein [Phycisphaerae bacterium]|nr:glycosyl hydrolase family 28-related protein [Phycisphaerae bacterium]HOJ75390.1 glycosyl hydrolase family 28-related protein [Phycisphaerae bacterium]HOM52630.1 glycosyl hydrolase family 28-related protein [Phycisphaerae bacterium]HON66640.1 glycosyl hydrolase family 28-related protein [Phycisphaerae bacterium]HOQ87144.1 glycosyl hydrolase family 28-related protein [Phycisphaerae bacterium]
MKTAFKLFLAFGMAAVAQAKEYSVIDAGAVADGKTDCTAAFQKALDEAARQGGGIVNVPAGHYRIDGHLQIPGGVTLQGVFRAPPSNRKDNQPQLNGSILLAYAGRGKREGEPFIRLTASTAGIAGLIITYPEWKQTDVPPVPYPPTVAVTEPFDNNFVIDCLFVNSYEAISIQNAGRFLIRNVYGYPSFRGLYVDNCLDIGRVENVHFWPFGVAYNPGDPYCKWVNTNGVAFEFARTDWQYVTNTFCFGYGVGYKFSRSAKGACNGNFLGIGADCCVRPVLVEDLQDSGLLITNGEFVGMWGSKDSVGLEIAEKAAVGKVSLNNCSFWGPIDRCVWARSPWVQFTVMGTHFMTHDVAGRNAPALQIDAGKAIIQGNTFGDGDTHVQIGPKVRSAIIMGNQAVGGLRVDNQAGKRTQMVANEESAFNWDAATSAHYRLDIGTPGDRAYIRHCFGAERFPIGDRKDITMRWSTGRTELRLPVLPGKKYTLSLDTHVPAPAIHSGNGLFLGDTRVLALPGEAYTGVLTGTIPATDQNEVVLTFRVKEWQPRKVIKDSQDYRDLGIALFSITMKAEDATGDPVDVLASE